MNRCVAALGLAGALAALPASSAGNDAAPLPRLWGNAGVGIGSYEIADDNPVLTLGLSLSGRYRQLAVTGRYTFLFDDPAFGNSARDFAILVGPVFRLGGAVVHPAVGVAGVTGSTYQLSGDTEFGPEAGTALGLTVFPSSVPVLALHAFANLNSSSDIIGAMLVFQRAQ